MHEPTHEWSHLPNAVHIDRVLATLKSHPEEWELAYSVAYATGPGWSVMNVIREGALTQARERHITYYSLRDVVHDAREYSARRASWDALAALMAYDDSANLLESTPEEIRLLVALGHPYAILFLPAALAFTNINSHNLL